MRRSILISISIAMFAVVAAWFVVGGTPAVPARFSLDECRKISLRDSDTGELVEGAADMAMLPGGGSLAVAAIERDDRRRPFSGLFEVSLFDIEQRSEEIEVDELVKSYNLDGGVYPEGIAINGEGDRLAIINRIGPDRRTVIDVVELKDGTIGDSERFRHKAYCRANDLAFDLSGNLLIARDLAHCRPSINDAFPWNATGLMLTLTPDGELTASEERYSFPSGIAIGPTGEPIIAETRSAKLTGGFADATLPGGPDNITVDDQGALIIAVHPSVWTLYLYNSGWAFNSPSRVIRADPERSDIEVLFDDPTSELMSAVSVGVMHEEKLYMGSPYDEGILVCEKQ